MLPMLPSKLTLKKVENGGLGDEINSTGKDGWEGDELQPDESRIDCPSFQG